MPLSPNQIREAQEKNSAPKVKEVIEKIDAAMLEGFDGESFTYGDIAGLDGVIERVVFAAYEQQGWLVERKSDQRDGDYWDFTPNE
jgi:hypothetical protein